MSELGIFYPKIPEGGGVTNIELTADGSNFTGNVSLADFKTLLSEGVVALSFPTEGDADVRVVAEYTDDSTNGLRIGVFSEDEYIVYSVVDDGNDGVTLTMVSESEIGTSASNVLEIAPTMVSQTVGYSDTVTYNEVKQHILTGGAVAITLPQMNIYWILSNPSFPIGIASNYISFIAYAYQMSVTSNTDGEFTKADLDSNITVNIISLAASEAHGLTMIRSTTTATIGQTQ